MRTKELIVEMHPGRTILEDVVEPLGLSVNSLAKRPSRAGEPVERHRAWPAWRNRRYGAAIGALFLELPRSSGSICRPPMTLKQLNSAKAGSSTSRCVPERRREAQRFGKSPCRAP